MALDLDLQDGSDDLVLEATPFDGSAEEALSLAVQAWHTMRAQFDAIDPSKLSAESREAYARMMARIGIWADAHCFGEPIEATE